MSILLRKFRTCLAIIKTQDYRIFDGGEFKDDENSRNETTHGMNSDDNQLNRGDKDENESINVVKEKSFYFQIRHLNVQKDNYIMSA